MHQLPIIAYSNDSQVWQQVSLRMTTTKTTTTITTTMTMRETSVDQQLSLMLI